MAPHVDFNYKLFESERARSGYRQGFYFLYRFSPSDAYEVKFGGDAKVLAVHTVLTDSDLLHGRTWKQ